MTAGYVDLQVNGHAGVDFNGDQWTIDQLLRCCRQLRDQGTVGILATVITAPEADMMRRAGRIADAIADEPEIARTVWGIHLEGPFLNPQSGYIGAHPTKATRPADLDLADRLRQRLGSTLRMWTLAPEQDPGGRVTRQLVDQGIVVAAGHSDATRDELAAAIDQGLSLYTHLGNGCPATLPRHDNIIQRVLAVADQIQISWIADGHHVPWFALGNYLRGLSDSQIVIVSDSMSAAGLEPGRYRLGDQWVEVDPDRSAWGEGRKNFAGSATSLAEMQPLLEANLGIPVEQFSRWSSENPRRLLGVG